MKEKISKYASRLLRCAPKSGQRPRSLLNSFPFLSPAVLFSQIFTRFPIARKKLSALRLLGWRSWRYAQTLITQRSCTAAREAASVLSYIECSIHTDQLESELKRQFRAFAYLLEPSVRYLCGNPTPFFATKNALHDGWMYALGKRNAAHLLDAYLKIHEMTGHTDQGLALWIEFLTRQGFERVNADSMSITLSPAVRKQYNNTAGLEDGCTVEIESHPWRYGADLAASGILKR